MAPDTRATTGRQRRLVWALLVVGALGLGWLVLNPDNSVGARAVSAVSRVAEAAGLPEVLTYRHVWEFVLNVALFAVLVFLTYLLWPALGVLGWTALTATLSGALELVQVLLPERTATVNDIAANTLGGLIGAALAALVSSVLAGRRVTAAESESCLGPR